jgi:hypothetical protein
MDIMQKSTMTAPLTLEELPAVVARHVESVEAIDVHTHLLPPNHGNLMLYGIDELLTYHYLVAELFMVLPLDSEEDSVSQPGDAPTPDLFFGWPKPRQADLVFKELFVRRTPLSEACRGVVTVLTRLGLGDELRRAMGKGGDLGEIRAWFAALDPAEHVERVFTAAKVRYAVMTNIPFSAEEAVHWMPSADGAPPPPVSDRFKTALRVDPLLAGDWTGICAVLSRSTPAYEHSLDGLRSFLRDWVKRIQPIYLMASTPGGFKYSRGRRPAPLWAAGEQPSAVQLIEQVLLPLAEECKLPLALKCGAVRGVNPELRSGGDGVEVADLSFIRQMCSHYPSVKFLVTVLSADNQHELCVLARKFGNLHVYGCWWFCNNPSIIEATTRMRLEMLGTAFTAQHSDCRVLEQLVYKWPHSRAVIAPLLAEQYAKLVRSGWELRVADVERDVHLLFGGAYEAFMAK